MVMSIIRFTSIIARMPSSSSSGTARSSAISVTPPRVWPITSRRRKSPFTTRSTLTMSSRRRSPSRRSGAPASPLRSSSFAGATAPIAQRLDLSGSASPFPTAARRRSRRRPEPPCRRADPCRSTQRFFATPRTGPTSRRW
ncbi:hypothetical protein RHECNPAF_1411003 [Rhizobium etli CNPAF512]|nr:hypothetical protein RHECNPAF_1411003 [Rhizobium etli CNPAF512]